MISRAVLVFNWFLVFYCSEAFGVKWTKRSAESPTYQEIKNSKPASFKIGGSDCTFTKENDDCPIKYKAKGACNLHTVSSQLFPDVNIEESTNKFIVPAKFDVKMLEMFACEGNPKDGTVSFVAKSVESVELAPQKLTLGAETRMRISWDTVKKFDPEKLEVKLKGFTSIGTDTRVELSVEKSSDSSDYALKFSPGTLNVKAFLAKFGVDAAKMIDSDLSFANSRMGLATLIMQEPKVDGLFSPGGGFEIVVTGKITAPELPADASKFFVIVQDFKDGSSESTNEGYGEPIAAFFAVYENEKIQDTISSLTHYDVPSLAVFKGVNEVAIAIATKEIFNINSKVVRDLAEKFVPVEGLNMIPKGLTIMHYSPNSNEDIKDKDNQAVKRVLFRVEVTKHGLNWTSPLRIETQMVKMVNLVWSMEGCQSLAIPLETKGVLVSLRYMKEDGQMEVSFNLTQRVPVLKNGLVSLLNSTIILFSKKKENTCSWTLGGKGNETILDELVEVTIVQTTHRTTVYAIADIFDMQTLMNRTRAKPFNEQYEKSFEFLTKVPFKGLRYEAVFEKKRVLRFKGFALMDGKPKIEIIYSIASGEPLMKLGFDFRNQYLYKVIRMFYREDKIKSTWIKFKKICISVKNKDLKDPIKFDRGCIREADGQMESSGIGLMAETLQAIDCHDQEWKMCNFIRTYSGGSLAMTYFGEMLPERVRMTARKQMQFELGRELFFRDEVTSEIDSTKDDDRLVFTGGVHLTRTSDKFPGGKWPGGIITSTVDRFCSSMELSVCSLLVKPKPQSPDMMARCFPLGCFSLQQSLEYFILNGKIYHDGSNNIMLYFKSDAGSQLGRDLLNLKYARMDPIRSKFAIPTDGRVQVVEFQSRLRIGSVEENQIEFSGHGARQYISVNNSAEPIIRFVGDKQKLMISNLYKAFDISDRHKFLRKAKFLGQLIVAYTSTDEVWNVKDLDLRVKKGLHFYGKMTLKTQETYETTINFNKNMQLQTIIHLDPLRYGKMANTSEGKPSFEHVNLFLHKDNERPELGPDLICEGQSEQLKGYAETVGLEGPFNADMKRVGNKDFNFEIKLKGKLYNEVENAEVTLTTAAVDLPKNFKFKYFVDITEQGKGNVNKHLRNALEEIKNHAKGGRNTAKKKESDVNELLSSYKKRRDGYLKEMDSVEKQIHAINADFDLKVIDLSAECINQCKTVMIPGIEWKEDCLKGSGGQRNMKCMSWKTNKEKAINVMCLLKCEAKKTASAGEATNNLEQIKVLVNRYRQQKALFEDTGKLIELIEQADVIAKSTKKLVDNNTDIHAELNALLALPGDLVELNVLTVDTDLDEITPPCLPFRLDLTLKTRTPTTHSGVYQICFNGEFYENVGIRMMRMKYSKIDGMYKVLEEAELRYARIDCIEKSLSRVEADIKETSKRGAIPSAPVKDPIEKMLMKIARRRIPAFTLKSDKTVLAFHHYSPWATIRRSDVLEMEPRPSYNVVYNASKLEGKSACQQTREIITEYRDISENLQQLSSNYKDGKLIYGKTKTSMLKDLESSRHEVVNLMNKTNLFPVERRDMLYWYQFTKQGMNSYLQTFKDHLSAQSVRSTSYMKTELSAFYGRENFIDHLVNLGSDALRRSTVQGPGKENQIRGLAKVGKELQRALSMNLDEAEGVITKLKGDIEALYHKASCD